MTEYEGGHGRASSSLYNNSPAAHLDNEELLLSSEVGDRWLASSSDSLQIDYSVLAVLVMTLGLIMIVEVARHRLDHAAKSRPFFKSVLKGVYTELTSLGLVELIIWLLHSYYNGLDVEKEKVFAKVHFTLFYIAIFNAFQTVFVAIFSMRVSRHHWVSTETLELNHYVEIREEFQRVKELVEERTPKQGGESDFENSHVSFTENAKAFTLDRQALRRRFRQMYHHVRYPHLHYRYNQLLVQIRFHELRVHLLQAYQLPMKMKVSDYLMRCELAVLIKLVHVSIVAWLLLTGTSNLLYYVLGIVSYEVEDTEVIGTTLEYLFFISMSGFVVIAGILRHKMWHIFGVIMHQRTLWDMSQTDEEKRQLATDQLKLFWLGSPKLVIAAIQFMQFGYALALAVVLIFWDLIASGHIAMRWYLIMIGATYSIFVWVVAKIIPQYTLCTCLGQLVDHRRLHETVSFFRLEESKRRRLDQIATHVEVSDLLVSGELKPTEAPKKKVGGALTFSPSESAVADSSATYLETPMPVPTTLIQEKSMSSLLVDLVKLDTNELRLNLSNVERNMPGRRQRRRERQRSVSDGVKLMASLSERSNDPNLADFVGNSQGGFRVPPEVDGRRTGAGRRKSVSDGVAFMASVLSREFGDKSLSELELTRSGSATTLGRGTPTTQSRSQTPVHFALVTSDTESLRTLLPESERLALEEREAMKRSHSGNRLLRRPFAGTTSVRDDLDGHYSFPSSKARRTVVLNPSEPLRPDDTALENLRARRRNVGTRRKAVSDGVAWMASVHSDPIGTGVDESTRQGRGTFQASLQVMQEGVISPESSVPFSETVPAGPSVVLDIPLSIKETTTSKEQEDTDNVNDESSVDSIDSVCEYSSDGSITDTVPQILVVHDASHASLSLRDWLRKYYLSKRFVLLSNVFGTMVVFFFIGQRVESFLTSQGLADPEYFVSFDFPNNINFWVVFAWHCLFLTTSGVIFWIFGNYSRLSSSQEKTLVLSAWFDGILTGFCLTMFCIAEAQRCCYPSGSSQDSDRTLASTGENQTSTENYGEPAPCSCPAFGSRQYGGLGNLEPFTSLIALRILRHTGVRFLVHYFETKVIAPSVPGDQETTELNNDTRAGMNPFAVFDDIENEKRRDHMIHEHGSIVELWQSAVESYPDIVSKYGEFSGELLQTMLGVPIIEPQSPPPYLTASIHGNAYTSPATYSQRRLYLDKKYSRLTPHAQEVIMAGKVGRPVKSSMHLTNLDEDEATHGYEGRLKGKLHFHVDQEKVKSTDLHDSAFSAPNERLVRSMRRGDRKLLPILKKWSVVDVVVTKYEMVYFDATDVDEPNGSQSIKEAIIATRGGKGLRLCDVAVGRRVVGHLDLSDIESVVVERELPNSHPRSDSDASAVFVPKIEYWQNSFVDSESTRSEQWRNTIQDVLKIQTTTGRTLYLRFYSDLAFAEAYPDRISAETNVEEPLFKNNALRWAQTLIRFCGPEQLKQNLPHFGNDTNDELLDLLQVKKFGAHRRNKSMDASHWQRAMSQRNLSAILPTQAAAVPKKPPLVRLASAKSDGTTRIRKPLLHRSSSVSGDFARDSGASHDRVRTSANGRSDNFVEGAGSGGFQTTTVGAASAMSSMGNGNATGSTMPTDPPNSSSATNPTSTNKDFSIGDMPKNFD